MKSFIATLQRMHGSKGAYRLSEITEAYNAFIKNQITDSSFKSDLKNDKYYTLNNPTHRWFGKLVKSTLKQNPNGLTPVYFGSQIDWVHVSFLI